MQLRTTSLAFALAVAASASACVIVDPDASLRVENRSSFEIHEMYVTPSESPTWGQNLLAGSVLFPGDSMFVALECGTYDALLVDETGAACDVIDVDLCFEDADWIIRNSTCSLFEERIAARPAPASEP